MKGQLLPRVLESFARLSAGADLIVVEGAGSPAEVNLRAGDIANMGFAEAADLPVVLIADIDRGGVIPSLVASTAVLGEAEPRRVSAHVVNKFRGHAPLFHYGPPIVHARHGRHEPGVGHLISDPATPP